MTQTKTILEVRKDYETQLLEALSNTSREINNVTCEFELERQGTISIEYNNHLIYATPLFENDLLGDKFNIPIEILNYDGVQIAFDIIEYPLGFDNIDKDINLYISLLNEYVASRL